MRNRFLFSIIVIYFLSISSIFTQAVTVPAKAETKSTISLDIKGMDIVDVLKMLATRAGLNIVIGKNVTGRVTLFLKEVDVLDAFEIIILANDLAYESKENIINVMTQRDYELMYGERFQDKRQAKIIQLKYAKAMELSKSLNQIKTNLGRIIVDETSNTLVIIDTPEKLKEMEDFIKNTELPVKTRVFELNYAQAEKLLPKLQETVTKVIGSIKIDERTNKIAITDYPNKLDEVAKIIKAFDEKTPQVLIDAQIIELRPSDKFEMGVDWDYWLKRNFELKAALPIGTANRLILGIPSAVNVSQKGDYKAILDLLRTIGDTKILSSPRIMVLNNQEAKILLGTKDAYITSTTSQGGSGTTVTSQTVNFVETGIKLFVTPTISRDSFVTMKIKPEVSSSKREEIISEDKKTEIPIVTTSEAETTITVKDGVTVIIGGLRKDTRNKTVKKIPLIGDIPLLGFFFRSTSDEVTTTELVILLTPHIMSGETSFTDFAQAPPKDGAVVKMVKGNIVRERVILPQEDKREELAQLSVEEDALFDYYRLVTERIQRFADQNSPDGASGEVTINFALSAKGYLMSEPYIISSSDSSLIPFATKALQDASPFPPFPKQLVKTEENFSITIEYR